MPALEVGVNFGVATHTVDKPKSSSNITGFGLYGFYAMPMFEAELGVMSQSMTTETPVDGQSEPAKTDYSATVINLGLSYVHNIAGVFSYVGGLDYIMKDAEETKAKLKIETSNLGLRLIGFRLNF